MLANVPRGRILNASSDEQTKGATMMATVIEKIASNDNQTKEAALKDEIGRHHSEHSLGKSPNTRSEDVREGVKVRKII